jgi:hypothetical protein
MALSSQQQREIIAADRARRDAREIEEYLALQAARGGTDHTRRVNGVDPYHVTRSITGEPSDRNRKHRPSGDYWTRGTFERGRIVGIAPGTEDTSDGTPTVRVTRADGTSEVRTVASFRQPREARQSRQASQAVQPESARIGGSQADYD